MPQSGVVVPLGKSFHGVVEDLSATSPPEEVLDPLPGVSTLEIALEATHTFEE